MKFTKSLFLASVACAVGFASAATVAYENDFSTRKSGPVQSGRWLERRYTNGYFAVNYGTATPTAETPYSTAGEMQDNWAKVVMGGKMAYVTMSIADNSLNETTGSNQFARFANSTMIVLSMGVSQSFFNSFSNGVLRIYADLRAPTNWPAGNGYIRVQPLYCSALETVIWASGTKTVRTFTNWGIQRPAYGESNYSGSMLIALVGNGSGGGQYLYNNNGTGHANRHWYRFVMDLNLSANTFTGTVYD